MAGVMDGIRSAPQHAAHGSSGGNSGPDDRNSHNLSKLRILTVDDNGFSRRIARSVLNALNVRTTLEVSSASEGLAAIPSFAPDLILSDWVMGPDDGLFFVNRVRIGFVPDARFIPIIVVSGYSEVWRVNLARDTGANEYVVKPYNAHTLYTKIRAIIESQRTFIEVPQGYFGPDRRRRARPITQDRRVTHVPAPQFASAAGA